VTELALDDVEWHALAHEFDGVRTARLARREPAANARLDGEPAELDAHPGARPWRSAGGPADGAEQRPDRQLDAGGESRSQLLEAPDVHADLAAPAARCRRATAAIRAGGRGRARRARAPAPTGTRCAWRAQPAGTETYVEESEHRSEETPPPEEQPPRSAAVREGPRPEEQLPRSAAGNEPATMIPSRERRRWGVERVLMRLVATGGIVGIGVLLGAVLVSQDVAGWIVGLVVALTSVALAAVLWSSREL
jgi:hypothetical protein